LVYHFKPRSCVELGSCLGLSAAYQATALKINNAGFLSTLEGSTEFSKIASETLAFCSVESFAKVISGPFHTTLPLLLNRIDPIDYAFIDGHHDCDATLKYFDLFKSHSSQNALFVFDDISWSDGMKAAWEKISRDPAVETAIDLKKVGICILGTESHFTRRISLL
jgi:predicted O-methyltransferase YrrM